MSYSEYLPYYATSETKKSGILSGLLDVKWDDSEYITDDSKYMDNKLYTLDTNDKKGCSLIDYVDKVRNSALAMEKIFVECLIIQFLVDNALIDDSDKLLDKITITSVHSIMSMPKKGLETLLKINEKLIAPYTTTMFSILGACVWFNAKSRDECIKYVHNNITFDTIDIAIKNNLSDDELTDIFTNNIAINTYISFIDTLLEQKHLIDNYVDNIISNIDTKIDTSCDRVVVYSVISSYLYDKKINNNYVSTLLYANKVISDKQLLLMLFYELDVQPEIHTSLHINANGISSITTNFNSATTGVTKQHIDKYIMLRNKIDTGDTNVDVSVNMWNIDAVDKEDTENDTKNKVVI